MDAAFTSPIDPTMNRVMKRSCKPPNSRSCCTFSTLKVENEYQEAELDDCNSTIVMLVNIGLQL